MTFANYPSLKDKVVYITGGTSGIGSDFVMQFALQGARVAFIGRTADLGEALVDAVVAAGHPQPLFLPCDASDVTALQATIQETQKQLGDIAVLVNNAANDQRHAVSEVTEDLWEQLMSINLKHQFFTAQAVQPMMQRLGGGSIINVSSNAFLTARIPHFVLYATAKSAIIGLTRSLAREFGGDHIRVNCIMPGWVMTDKQIRQWLTPEAEAELMEEQSLKAKLYPEDISRLALFLAADDSRMITKQLFIADAGRV